MAFREFETVQISRRSMLRTGAFAALAGGASVAPLGRLALAHAPAVHWPTVSAAIEQYVGGGKVANMVAVLGFGQEAPQVLAKGGLGFGSASPAGTDSIFRLYSQTKPITGMAIMSLIDDRELKLDQPLADIFPAFADMRVLKSPTGPLNDTMPAERLITIRQLLTHTAGLGYELMPAGPLRDAYRRAGISSGQVSKLPIPGFPPVKSAPTLKEFAERLATLPLAYQPGTRWAYSASLDVLGSVIEQVAAMPFGRYLHGRFFAPLGMTSTGFTVPAAQRARLTDNYGLLGGIPIPIDPAVASLYSEKPPLEWGGSGLAGSPADYDRFQRMLLGRGVFEGTQVLGEQAVQLGMTNILPDGVQLKGTWMQGGGFGAGGAVRQDGFGWGGAAGTNAFVHLPSGLRAGMYTQYMPSEALPIQNKFPEWVLKDLMAQQTVG